MSVTVLSQSVVMEWNKLSSNGMRAMALNINNISVRLSVEAEEEAVWKEKIPHL